MHTTTNWSGLVYASHRSQSGVADSARDLASRASLRRGVKTGVERGTSEALTSVVAKERTRPRATGERRKKADDRLGVLVLPRGAELVRVLVNLIHFLHTLRDAGIFLQSKLEKELGTDLTGDVFAASLRMLRRRQLYWPIGTTDVRFCVPSFQSGQNAWYLALYRLLYYRASVDPSDISDNDTENGSMHTQ